MPTLARLMANGMRFTRCITPSPLCAPARACLATARGYDRTGVWNNRYSMPLELPTIYEALRSAGYSVASYGKLDLAKPPRDWGGDGRRLMTEWGFTHGFDSEGKYDGSGSYRARPDDPPGPYLRYLAGRGYAEAHVHDYETRHPFLGTDPCPLPDDAYGDTWIGTNAADGLRGLPVGRPWFLQVNFTGPHNPMDVTESMHTRWRDAEVPPAVANESDPPDLIAASRRNYAAMLENIDRQIDRLLQVVDERGERDRTIVVYASDHGELLGDHGLWGKSTWRRAAINVPLIVAGATSAAGDASGSTDAAIVDEPVSLIDLAAGFLETAGADPIPGADGRPLRLASTAWAPAADAQRSVVSSLRVRRAGAPGEQVDRSGFRAIVTDEFAYSRTASGEEHLFRWGDDPLEEHDLAAEHPTTCTELRAELQSMRG